MAPSPSEAEPGSTRARAHAPRLDLDARVARALLVGLPLAAILVVGGARFATQQRAVKVVVARGIAEALANRTQSGVRLGDLELDWALAPCISELALFRTSETLKITASSSAACVRHWPSALGSGFRALRVELARPRLELEGLRPGANVASLVEVAPARAEDAERPAGAPSARPALREVSIGFDGLELGWSNLPVPARLRGGRLGPLDGELTLQRRGAESAVTLAVREPSTGLALAGRATPTPRGFDVGISVDGDLGPKLAPLFESAGLDVKALPIRGEIGAIYTRAPRQLVVDVDLVEAGADVASGMVSARRLVGFGARQKFRAELDLERARLHVEDGLFELNGVPFVVDADVERGDAGLALDLALSLPTVSLARLLAAIPGAVTLDTLAVPPEVQFALTARLTGQLTDPETWQVAVDQRVIGVGANAQGSGLEPLLGPRFAYRPLTREGRSEAALEVGRATPSWVRYTEVPYFARRAVQVSEDASFFTHHGLDLDELRAAVVDAVATGERARGGSTLTQQLVKNLFLTRERTALRKVQELLLTFLVEASLTKEQIFELYLNVIEWGPELHGLRAAATNYFGKTPAQLTPREAAYLAAIIPGPILYHQHYEQGAVPAKFIPKVEGLLDKLVKLGTLKAEDLKPLDQDPIRFRRR